MIPCVVCDFSTVKYEFSVVYTCSIYSLQAINTALGRRPVQSFVYNFYCPSHAYPYYSAECLIALEYLDHVRLKWWALNYWKDLKELFTQAVVVEGLCYFFVGGGGGRGMFAQWKERLAITSHVFCFVIFQYNQRKVNKKCENFFNIHIIDRWAWGMQVSMV